MWLWSCDTKCRIKTDTEPCQWISSSCFNNRMTFAYVNIYWCLAEYGYYSEYLCRLGATWGRRRENRTTVVRNSRRGSTSFENIDIRWNLPTACHSSINAHTIIEPSCSRLHLIFLRPKMSTAKRVRISQKWCTISFIALYLLSCGFFCLCNNTCILFRRSSHRSWWSMVSHSCLCSDRFTHLYVTQRWFVRLPHKCGLFTHIRC